MTAALAAVAGAVILKLKTKKNPAANSIRISSIGPNSKIAFFRPGWVPTQAGPPSDPFQGIARLGTA